MRALLSRVRRPEYTGENRCWPCTATNALALAAACLVVAPASPPAAAALGVGGAAAIGLRGYLVPYTPRLAPRLAAAVPGLDVDHGRVGPRDRPADAERTIAAPEGEDRPDPDDALATLVEAGVVVPEGDRVSLSPPVRERWRAEIERLRGLSDADLADAVREAAPGETTVEVRRGDGGERTWIVLSGPAESVANEAWLPRPVAVAEAAAVRALADEGIPREVRGAVAHALGLLLERCPTCDAALVETTESACCGGPSGSPTKPPADVLACPECDRELYRL